MVSELLERIGFKMVPVIVGDENYRDWREIFDLAGKRCHPRHHAAERRSMVAKNWIRENKLIMDLDEIGRMSDKVRPDP
jgi:SH3-like domain-containing protein